MTHQDRLLDLLVSRATEGLSREDSQELDDAFGESTDPDAESLDLAAAAVDLALHNAAADDVPLPPDLRQRIVRQATTDRPARRGVFDARYLGWHAAAAMLALGLWAPWRLWSERPTATPTPAEQRSALIESAPDVIQVAWAIPEIPAYAQVKGDVVWSNRSQAGFMRLTGLPANRRSVEQYQLWIVDPSRDKNPIDGGVFDVPAGVGEIVVPIDAKLRVNAPQIFALTLEHAGGVVVSDGPLLVVAPVRT